MSIIHTAVMLIGQPVEIGSRNSQWGDLTLRWGTLRAVENGTTLIVDDYHDSAGIGAYLPGRGCNVTEGVPVSVDTVVSIGTPRRYR